MVCIGWRDLIRLWIMDQGKSILNLKTKKLAVMFCKWVTHNVKKKLLRGVFMCVVRCVFVFVVRGVFVCDMRSVLQGLCLCVLCVCYEECVCLYCVGCVLLYDEMRDVFVCMCFSLFMCWILLVDDDQHRGV